jgi:hypothetical protein
MQSMASKNPESPLDTLLKTKGLTFLLGILLAGVACKKEELPVKPHEPGEVVKEQLDMKADYRYQLFFDLKEHEVVGRNLKTEWDLGFESGPNGWHVILNSSRGGGAAATGTEDLKAVNDTSGVEWEHDHPDGDLDSTAIGDHRGKQEVYIIDRGYDPQGDHTGFRKLVIEEVTKDSYTIRFAHLDGTGDTTMKVEKDPKVNFTAFSFDRKERVPVRPAKGSWDLLFTQYTHIFYDPYNPYSVTGVLLNRNEVEVAIDSSTEFKEIRYEDVEGYSFTERRDGIGYDWKTYDFNSGNYRVHTDINYIVRSTEGRYFKLRFLDFYDGSGNKGHPSFELKEL